MQRGEPGSPTWLVDPNDGTRDYLAGYRGSSVAIGLVRDDGRSSAWCSSSPIGMLLAGLLVALAVGIGFGFYPACTPRI